MEHGEARTAPDSAAIQEALERIVASAVFAHSPRMSRFLRFVVDETVAGRGGDLKEYVVGVRVFDKADSYDPAVNPTVRAEASKLRARLARYYETEGRRDAVIIHVPKGGYSARFNGRASTDPEPLAVNPDSASASSAERRSWAPAGNSEAAATPSPGGSARARAARQRVWRAGLLALAVLTAGIVAILALGRASAPSRVRFTDPLQITSGTGAEGWASWSPDGRMLAYASDQAGNFDIWVAQLDGSPGINRTQDHGGSDSAASWSPDGNEIAFVSDRDGTLCIYVMPALTGAARKLAGPAFGTPQWSPDGTELAYLVAAPRRTEVEIVSLTTHASRRVALEVGELSAMDLSWSPDGRFFAYVVGAGTRSLVSQVWLLPLAGGMAFPITDGLNNDRWPVWAADARSLFLTSERGGDTDLWQQRLVHDGRPTDALYPVTAGLGIQSAVPVARWPPCGLHEGTPDRKPLAHSHSG